MIENFVEERKDWREDRFTSFHGFHDSNLENINIIEDIDDFLEFKLLRVSVKFRLNLLALCKL